MALTTGKLNYTVDEINEKLDLIDGDTIELTSSLKIGNQILTEKLIETLSKIEAAGTLTFGSEDN
jgi:hypothetical protein